MFSLQNQVPAGLLALLVSPVIGAGILSTDKPTEPDKFFQEFVGLNDGQIGEIREGKAIAKILDSPTADQVFVFGSVHMNSTPERYLKFASDIDVLRKRPSYIGRK